MSLRQSSRPRTDSVLCFILAYSNVQHLQCKESTKGKTINHLNLMTNIEPLCCKNHAQLRTTAQVSFLLSCCWSQTSQDKDEEMVAYLTALWLNLKSPNIFNLRVEYIRPTALTRFTCCHLLPVGGEIWGSEADRGKALNRQEHTRDRCGKILGHPKRSSTLSYISAMLFTSLRLLVHQMTAPRQRHS